MNTGFDNKVIEITQLFSKLSSQSEIYQKIIAYGKTCKGLAEDEKTEIHRIRGCQSNLYLIAKLIHGKIIFSADSDALITKGLAALMTYIYSNEDPKTLIEKPPLFLKELGILSSLSLNRANGLKSLYLAMQKKAIFYMQ